MSPGPWTLQQPVQVRRSISSFDYPVLQTVIIQCAHTDIPTRWKEVLLSLQVHLGTLPLVQINRLVIV